MFKRVIFAIEMIAGTLTRYPAVCSTPNLNNFYLGSGGQKLRPPSSEALQYHTQGSDIRGLLGGP